MALGAGKPRMALCRAEADLLASPLLARKAGLFEHGGAGSPSSRIELADCSLQRASTQAVAPGRARLLIEVAKCGLG
jgi:hypothetical protein